MALSKKLTQEAISDVKFLILSRLMTDTAYRQKVVKVGSVAPSDLNLPPDAKRILP